MNLQKVSTNFFSSVKTYGNWMQPFNQATFFNYDTVNSLFINNWELAPAQIIGGNVYPTFLEISLNFGEINDTFFNLDTKGSSTGNFRIIYTQYLGLPLLER